MMKQTAFLFCMVPALLLLCIKCLASASPINKYRVEKRSIARELASSEYTIAARDTVKVTKPRFPYYTKLNLLDIKIYRHWSTNT